MKYSISGTVQAWNRDGEIELIPDQENTSTINGKKFALFLGPEIYEKDADKINAFLVRYNNFLKINIGKKICFLSNLHACHIKVFVDSEKNESIKADEYITVSSTNFIVLGK